jgi:RIO kinase 1
MNTSSHLTARCENCIETFYAVEDISKVYFRKMDEQLDFSRYDQYEYFDGSRRSHRYRDGGSKKKRRKKNPMELAAELTDFSDSITDFVPSYAAALDPLHHERQWVINSVAHFYQENIITDVTRLVKGGKEANVYCCDAHPATGLERMAAKLYRPRMLRHLKNDAIYKAGRQLRSEDGKQIKGRRVKLALRKKTKFGKRVDIMWWIGNEYSSQRALYQAGADVPRPVAHNGTAILMEYIGDRYTVAPTLNEVMLDSSEANALFQRIMANIALMLDNHFVHGDLSAYNILYWNGEIKIIDFPQMVDARTNPHAFKLLQRDIRRTCEHFGRLGVTSDPEELTLDLWQPYMGRSY